MTTVLTPKEFAALTVDEKHVYQVGIAGDIYTRAISGEPITQSEHDFAFRMLNKEIPQVISTGSREAEVLDWSDAPLIGGGGDSITQWLDKLGTLGKILVALAAIFLVVKVIQLWKDS